MIESNKNSNEGTSMYEIIKKLFPICRSITGNGTRKSLEIISENIHIKTYEIPTGTQVFDWKIPKEWNILDAYIIDPNKKKIVDFKNSNLHILNYSIPIKKKINFDELKDHIFTDPKHPDDIPYRTSYYSENWGFCMAHNEFLKLKDGIYEVFIDSTLKNGNLTYGEYFFQGKYDEEILFSCYICHPSMCNDSLSGVALTIELAKYIKNLKSKPNYSYRFLFIPETIGSITWLSKNEEKIKKIKHGLVVTCVGDSGNMTYKKTRQNNSEINKTVIDVLKNSTQNYKILDFFPSGSDERQYCSPGINLNIGCLTRSMFTQFPEYHTSSDNLNFVNSESLSDTFQIYTSIISKLEENFGKFFTKNTIHENKKYTKNDPVYINLFPKCEPHLGKRGIYHLVGGQNPLYDLIKEKAMMWILAYSDGTYSLKDISDRSKIDFDILKEVGILLLDKQLIKIKST